MNDSLFSTKDMVKYIIVGGLVYAILKMIPSVQLADKDLMLLLAIITVGFVCLDCLFLKKSSKENFANDDPFTLDLDTDINELIKQRQAKRQEARREAVASDTPEEAQRKQILNRLEEKRRKASDPVEETKKEIKKLATQISTASTVVEAETARKAKAELEQKLQVLKASGLTAEEELRLQLAREEKRTQVEQTSVGVSDTPVNKTDAQIQKLAAEEEQASAIVARVVADKKLVELEKLKTAAASSGNTADVKAIAEEIEVTTKAKVIAEERIVIAEKRKETVDKILADIPVSQEEQRALAIQESVIADARVEVAEELKAIAEKSGSTTELKQIIQEQKDAIIAKVDAEDKLVQVEERRAPRVVIDESIKLPEDGEVTSNRALPKTSCGMEVEKIKRQMEEEMAELREQLKVRAAIPPSNAKIANRYFESLMNDLADKGILDAAEIDNIQAKLRSKLLSMDEVIASLETLKKEGKSKNDRDYSELPSDFYTPIGQQVPNDWTSEYTILNTNKWQVPMPRPPVCINTQPCKVCPSDSSNYPVNLKQWDDSRYVTGGRVNKKWAEDQNSA